MDAYSTDIRRAAFEKLAKLAVNGPPCEESQQLIPRLTAPYNFRRTAANGLFDDVSRIHASGSRPPMGMRELDVLLGLCKSAPFIRKLGQASELTSHLSQYLPESYGQAFRASPFLRNIEPSPWEVLTYDLTSSLLSIGVKFPSLHKQIEAVIDEYLSNCEEASRTVIPLQHSGLENESYSFSQKSFGLLTIAVSLVGFLKASAIHNTFWSASKRLLIVSQLRAIFSDDFMVAVETASSTIRSAAPSDSGIKAWKRCTRHYAAHGRPLGAMLVRQEYMRFAKACVASGVTSSNASSGDGLMDDYLNGIGIAQGKNDSELALVECIAEIVTDEIHLLEDGADYLQLGSPSQQKLAFSVKALALVGYLNCLILGGGAANADTFLAWLEDTLVDPHQMSCYELAAATLKCIAAMARLMPNSASGASRSLLRFIVQRGVLTGSIIDAAARSLAQVLALLSQDAIITTLYSLGNVLSPVASPERPYQYQTAGNLIGRVDTITSYSPPKNGSIVSIPVNGEEDNMTFRNVTHAIVVISTSRNDEKISALAQSMLLQKIGKVNAVVDSYIIQEAAELALSSEQAEFQLLLKFYDRTHRDALAKGHAIVSDAVQNAMNYLSIRLTPESPLHKLYLIHLLEGIVNKGDATGFESNRQQEMAFTADDITPLLKPLALLVSSNNETPGGHSSTSKYEEEISYMFRDAWFNMAVHGITANSIVSQSHSEELRLLAKYSPPLIAGNYLDVLESDVELNIILRRGETPQRVAEQKRVLIAELPGRESEIKRLNYPKVVFLNAALLIETFRAASGNCTSVLDYFRDPALNTAEMASCMSAIAEKVVNFYLSMTLSGNHEQFSSSYLAKQLAGFFAACCHRIERVQSVAVFCATRIINECPSALCEKSSLFALLELLSVMWSSCLEGELDEFDWRSSFVSSRGNVKVDLSDDYNFRKRTLDSFLERARVWVPMVMNIAPLDIKGLLQTYLSEYDDEGSYGHISLGRSFALEIGSLIPQSDQRLGSIERHDISVNVSSDFISQYTTRQKYRSSDVPPSVHVEDGLIIDKDLSTSNSPSFANISQNLEHSLSCLYEKSVRGEDVSPIQVRDELRQAAAVLCSSNEMHPSLIHYLVVLPFQIFTKDMIKLGISLWLGVIHEKPLAEPRILMEAAGEWEKTVRRRGGLFDPSLEHLDPMLTKIELLPTDKALLLKKQQKAQNTISPHSRLLHFFESHFNAIRLSNNQNQHLFFRLISKTVIGLLHSNGHPLSREIHFRIVLLGLKVLRYSTAKSKPAAWKLKDQILSAALGWFRHPPRWSFGGNRLQIRAEDKVLGDVVAALGHVAGIATHNRGALKPLQAKQDLLNIFIDNERARLKVWLFPLDHERRHHSSSLLGNKNFIEESSSLLRLAWAETPGLAIQLASRFPSAKLQNDIRWLLLNFPEKALNEPQGLEILFGSSLPADVSFQLKYLLYWAPVNPIEALTYFLPAYGNHSFILQYAMRALESHAIDVRFYFVPQLVQALRYDALGYVERYIFETAKLSQLFAHQVIWNMKANSYKDEDSQIPDPLKPTLDKFMEILISSFSNEEREFYEREFSFFNEITDISGKLRPYIKKSKAEKKEKIEEELRKIKVEVGVYLPSNPDGVVVGIDRKSGKPLQSHAKAPYMATFRIRKTRNRWDGSSMGGSTGIRASSHQQLVAGSQETLESEAVQESYEVWQSAIFKVGDDCRQDMLALQMIAAFRSIFANVGLDVWVFPYRVTSTAPGCGVIDVLPNSISRDMLGREAVNGLYDYFVSKYGGEDSIKFQEARTNFVKSMAAYSVISYLLQFKDRHNGNIMIDDAGHIIHIDFGFCFDIAPGGVRFERAPFKLTSEMVAVMGGSHAHHHGHTPGGSSSGLSLPGGHSHNPTTTQAYQWFESLVVKAFLASRPHCHKLSHIVSLMLDSGLPCFKPDTLKNFRDRFALDKSERDAAEHMRELTRKSYMSVSTKGYDQFQLLTNGIPY
ncbi:hypothetical protein ASPZODRAFT_1254817 [Penicilliopsis zonata CBS 506.65]|uniref:1-phosphatidylinositol 4-kinase n=1 Tax=Penicilliopsis zonata CBS 506.65 TaxID=1073090 RepID=A0A1L9S776_9EURO|nr:hypothetical protein ASPZODRAFT_1254817 [Penicilliopsis zonata CBS 506.65]OJJ43004.1 hypothetical protein ASPZODRAFT_1254817 [Penicilliopsis zonata CBS 506.65]